MCFLKVFIPFQFRLLFRSGIATKSYMRKDTKEFETKKLLTIIFFKYKA